MKKKSIAKLKLNKKPIANFQREKTNGGQGFAYASGWWTLDDWCEPEIATEGEENPNPRNLCFGEWW